MSPATSSTVSPSSVRHVIAPATTWMNSWVSSNHRDGPGVHSQIPTSWSPSPFHRV